MSLGWALRGFAGRGPLGDIVPVRRWRSEVSQDGRGVQVSSGAAVLGDGVPAVAAEIFPVVPHGIRESYASGRRPAGRLPEPRQVGWPSRTALMVPRGFAWEQFREKDKIVEMSFIQHWPKRDSWRMSRIMHGSNGIVYWGLPCAAGAAAPHAHLARYRAQSRLRHRVECEALG
jgi:hypothetical protein